MIYNCVQNHMYTAVNGISLQWLCKPTNICSFSVYSLTNADQLENNIFLPISCMQKFKNQTCFFMNMSQVLFSDYIVFTDFGTSLTYFWIQS